VRAGNVIGGGDWSEDRLIPDIVRAIVRGEAVHIRNPNATRPWQHVLEPLRGYLAVAGRLWTTGGECAEAWNFGPDSGLHVTVKDLVERFVWTWGEGRIVIDQGPHPHEANYLALDSGKARSRLDWLPLLDFEQTVALTADWYKVYYADPAAAAEITATQLAHYRRKIPVSNPLADTFRAAEPAS
jgi:CDP-glucose 4,6-dehydratase